MKKIGIIGGLGPESTILYYKELIDRYQSKSKGREPEIIINSVSLTEFKRYMDNHDFNSAVKLLSGAADSLVKGGADFISMASNTPHIFFSEISKKSEVPMISIVEETAKAADKISKNRKIGLLGTRFIMKSDLYPESFRKYGMNIYTPEITEQDYIHEKIFSELNKGIISENTKTRFLETVKSMIENIAIDSLVLGCTELPLIFDKEYFGINYLNTVIIHVDSIIDFCFRE
ncbi:MAG: amino acid racemase [Bacteroidales bacterium]|nr:amino acid racemase [Bacteroidales bacterium]